MKMLGITFNEFIQKGNVIVGIILAILGIAIWLLAANITKVVRQSTSAKQNDTVYTSCKVIGLISLLIGMVLIAIPL